jgi:hypothetical protein
LNAALRTFDYVGRRQAPVQGRRDLETLRGEYLAHPFAQAACRRLVVALEESGQLFEALVALFGRLDLPDEFASDSAPALAARLDLDEELGRRINTLGLEHPLSPLQTIPGVGQVWPLSGHRGRGAVQVRLCAQHNRSFFRERQTP